MFGERSESNERNDEKDGKWTTEMSEVTANSRVTTKERIEGKLKCFRLEAHQPNDDSKLQIQETERKAANGEIIVCLTNEFLFLAEMYSISLPQALKRSTIPYRIQYPIQLMAKFINNHFICACKQFESLAYLFQFLLSLKNISVGWHSLHLRHWFVTSLAQTCRPRLLFVHFNRVHTHTKMI